MNYRNSKFKVQSSKQAWDTNGHVQWNFIVSDLHNGDPIGDALLLNDGLAPSPEGPVWDLAERTALFGEAIVRFAKKIPRDPANNRLISQLVGAGTSVGANYCEANECVSEKDFKLSVSRCMKEAKETKFFLRMAVASEKDLADEARTLYREAHELLRIFGAMRHKRPKL